MFGCFHMCMQTEYENSHLHIQSLNTNKTKIDKQVLGNSKDLLCAPKTRTWSWARGWDWGLFLYINGHMQIILKQGEKSGVEWSYGGG